MLERQSMVHPRYALPILLAASFLVPAVRPQSSVTTPPEIPPGDISFYLGQPVDHPEDLSGVWETSNGQGGAVGIHLSLTTSISDDAEPPVWSPPTWQQLSLSVFERKGPEFVLGEENYFSDSLRGGSVKLVNDHLELHFVAPARTRTQVQIEAERSLGISVPSEVDLELVRQADGCWHGRFHRGSFDSVVTLCRPAPESGAAQSPLVGNWSNGGGGCVHVFETGQGTFIGWSDAVQVPGRIIFARNSPKPHRLYQNYGELAKVYLGNNGEVSIEFGAYSAWCCSHLFVGTLSADGSSIQGNFPPGLNQAPHAASWTKLRDDSCVASPTLHRPEPVACPPGKN